MSQIPDGAAMDTGAALSALSVSASSSPLPKTKSNSILNLSNSLKKGTSRLSLASLSSTIGRNRSKKVTKEIAAIAEISIDNENGEADAAQVKNNTQKSAGSGSANPPPNGILNGNGNVTKNLANESNNDSRKIFKTPIKTTSQTQKPQNFKSINNLQNANNAKVNGISSGSEIVKTGENSGKSSPISGHGGGHGGHLSSGSTTSAHSRFSADGLTFKGKLIGILEVSGPRGDRLCQEALSELKMAVKAAGEHKQKILININLDGIRIRDEKTGDSLHHHLVHRISFIAQDLTDSRAFGYIFGSPETGHRFFGIKTEKNASTVVMAMRDLFQVVFDLKKKEIERAKERLGGGDIDGASGSGGAGKVVTYLVTRSSTPGGSGVGGIGATGVDSSKVDQKLINLESNSGSPCSTSGGAVGGSSGTDLLNLEVELSSLQTGLDSFRHQFSLPHQNSIVERAGPTSSGSGGAPGPDAFGMETFVPPPTLRSTTIGVCPLPSAPAAIIEDPFKHTDPFGGGRYDVPPGVVEFIGDDIGSVGGSSGMDPFDTSGSSMPERASWEASFDDEFSHHDVSAANTSCSTSGYEVPIQNQVPTVPVPVAPAPVSLIPSKPMPLSSELFSDLDPLFSLTANKSPKMPSTATAPAATASPKIPTLVPPPTNVSSAIKNSFSSNFNPPGTGTGSPGSAAVGAPAAVSPSIQQSAATKRNKLKNLHVTVSCTLPRGSGGGGAGSGSADISNFKLPRPASSGTGSLSRRSGVKYGRYEAPPGPGPTHHGHSVVPPSPPPRPPITLLQNSSLELSATCGSPTAIPPPLPPKKQQALPPHNFTFSHAHHNNQRLNATVSAPPGSSHHKPPAQQPPLPLPPPSAKKTSAPPTNQNSASAPAPSPQPSISTLINELSQLSLSELGARLHLPVEELSGYSIRELALQLQEKKLREASQSHAPAPTVPPKGVPTSLAPTSAAPVPPPASRYEVFRELDNLSTHSGFSVGGGSINNVNDSEDYTLVDGGGTEGFHTAKESTPSSLIEDNTLNDVSDDEFAPTLLEDIDATTTAPGGGPKEWACFDNYGLIEGVNGDRGGSGGDIEEIGLEPLSIGWDDEIDEEDDEDATLPIQAPPPPLKPPPQLHHIVDQPPPLPTSRPPLSEESRSHSSKYTTEEEDERESHDATRPTHRRGSGSATGTGRRKPSREDDDDYNDYSSASQRRERSHRHAHAKGSSTSGRRSRGGYEDDLEDEYYGQYDRPSSGRPLPSSRRRYYPGDDFEDDRSYRSGGGDWSSRRGPPPPPIEDRERDRHGPSRTSKPRWRPHNSYDNELASPVVNRRHHHRLSPRYHDEDEGTSGGGGGSGRRRRRRKSHDLSYSEEEDTEDSNSYYSSNSSTAAPPGDKRRHRGGDRERDRDRDYHPPPPLPKIRGRRRTISDEEADEEEDERSNTSATAARSSHTKYKYYDDYEDDYRRRDRDREVGRGRRSRGPYEEEPERSSGGSRPNSGRTRDEEFYSISRGGGGSGRRRYSSREEEDDDQSHARRRGQASTNQNHRDREREVFEDTSQQRRKSSESPHPCHVPSSPKEEVPRSEVTIPEPTPRSPKSEEPPQPPPPQQSFFDDNFTSTPFPPEPPTSTMTNHLPQVSSSIDTIPEEEDEDDRAVNGKSNPKSPIPTELEPEMKKSDSFNIFGTKGNNPMEFDPFKDDDFFN